MSTVEAMVAVQLVDADVHPYPSPTNSYLVAEHTPEPWRSRMFAKGTKYRHGDSILWDPPEYAEAVAMRVDSRPPSGGFPCSDPDFALEQLVQGAGVDVAILQQTVKGEIAPEAELARHIGYNGWLAEAWLGAANRHGRWLGSIGVTLTDPVGSAREIERWAGHPEMVQVLVSPNVRLGMGDPHFDPLYEAASRHGLPVAVHLMRGPDERLPLNPVGFGSWYIDYTNLISFLYEAHVASLVFDGAFDRFPDLKVVLVEGGFTWMLPLMWRMDAIWQARRGELPWVKRPPSDYVREHIRLTTQPLDDPDDLAEMMRCLEWLGSDSLLHFSTDYPHWSADDPTWAVRRLPTELRSKVMAENAIEFHDLPRWVPALPI